MGAQRLFVADDPAPSIFRSRIVMFEFPAEWSSLETIPSRNVEAGLRSPLITDRAPCPDNVVWLGNSTMPYRPITSSSATNVQSLSSTCLGPGSVRASIAARISPCISQTPLPFQSPTQA